VVETYRFVFMVDWSGPGPPSMFFTSKLADDY
jgi:hypothetical protein